ncbi:hypothetical protein D9M71_839820 [compost metagenome]
MIQGDRKSMEKTTTLCPKKNFCIKWPNKSLSNLKRSIQVHFMVLCVPKSNVSGKRVKMLFSILMSSEDYV